MKWFYDLKIKMKVLLGFCFVAIIAGIIGYIGIYNLEVNNERGTSLYQNNTIGVQYVGDIAANQQKVRMLIRDVIIEKSLAGKNKYMASIQALDKTCDERIAALEELMDTEQEKKDLVDLKSAIGNYRPIRDQISQLSLAGKDDVALILMRGDGAKVGGELDQAVAKVFKTEIDSAKTTADENTASTNSAVYIMIGFLLVGIVIAIGLGIFIARGISNPLQQSLAMIQEMGRGHLGQRLHMETKDEVGMMAQAMDQFADDLQNNVIGTMHKIANGDISTEMVAKDSQDEITPALKNTIDSLRGLITEAKVLTDAAVQGKLDIRGDVTKFKGAYQEIVKGINDTLDSVIGPLNVAAEYIDRISKGDIPPKVTDTYYGDFNEIKNNLNQCIDGLGALVESKEVVGRMAVNDYTKRVEGHYLGIFADIASSINGVRDRLIHVQDIVQNIALGDFKDLNDLKAVGRRSEQDKLIPSLLAMVESVRGLVEETIGLAQNAVEGNLAYRGDAKKFNGEYQKVVEGINQTLDAISAPVIEAITVLEEMAKGNLQVSVKGNYRGDQAKIKDALNFTIGNLQSYIGEISGTLTEMANGNLDVAIDRDYLGDFMEIKNSLNLIIESFNDVLNDLNSASEQVASGSKHVSASSQALSQGSSEQASTVEEINSSMAEIATQTKQNAVNANQANELALAAKDNAVNGNEQMKGMLGAMAEINEASTNISKIIKVIDDIAFQTNILALNAAVEAARAGQHGKGFAVVAEEVRNLAARSADAAKETTSLIEGTVKKVEAGAGIANQTATALDQIVDGVTKATNLVGEIAGASNEQATAITQVNQGISQVATVIQNNTATAEESAAASEQLSSQAELLKSMVAKFQIKDQDGRRSKTVAMKTAGHLETAAPKPKKVKIALDDKDFAKY